MPLHNVRAIALPYCLKRQPDGRYLVLNRNYKPLGFNNLDFVTHSVRLPELTEAVARRLSWDQRPDVEQIFLYVGENNPECSPAAWRAYSQRLEILANLKVVLD